MQIDLNCDIGEGFGIYQMGADEALMPLISSANIACGFHAGDPQTLDRTIALASQNGVSVGAHPGYLDLRGFGRRPIQATPEEVEADVLYQVGAVAGFARAHGVELVHVKPHGALYNQAVNDDGLSRAIARGVARFSKALIFVGLATSKAMRDAAEAEGLRYAGEAFADRVYNPDGLEKGRRAGGFHRRWKSDVARWSGGYTSGGNAVSSRGHSRCTRKRTGYTEGSGRRGNRSAFPR